MKMNHEQQREQLKQVYFALLEKGYNPLGQLVGYLLTEDPHLHHKPQSRPCQNPKTGPGQTFS